ncbi:MAG: peptidylprolyl isomerase [Gammaproteobacteria bacterium]
MRQSTTSKLLTTLLMALYLCSPASAQQRELLDRVVAIVDDGVVLQSELETRITDTKATAQARNQPLPPDPQLRQELLDVLIIESLQMQLAERVSIRYDDDTINRVLGNMADNNNLSFDEYVRTLEAAGMYLQTREEVRKQLTMQELQRGMVNRRITITSQEIDNFLNSEMGREILSATYRLEHMVVEISPTDTPQIRQAKLAYTADLAERMRETDDFIGIRANAARENRFPINATAFGYRKANQLPEIFRGVVEGMAVGDIEGPIEAGNGYHIIGLAEKRGGTDQLVNQTLIRHIMLAPNEIRTNQQSYDQILEFRQRILDGEDFATIARQNSDDASSVVAGGDLGWINETGMPPSMKVVIDELEVGELSVPFQTDTGWHIAEVLDRRVEDMSVQYTRNEAENALRNRKFDLELENWLIEIREEAFVEYID